MEQFELKGLPVKATKWKFVNTCIEGLLNNNIIFFDEKRGYYVVNSLFERIHLKQGDYIIREADGIHHFTIPGQYFEKLFKANS